MITPHMESKLLLSLDSDCGTGIALHHVLKEDGTSFYNFYYGDRSGDGEQSYDTLEEAIPEVEQMMHNFRCDRLHRRLPEDFMTIEAGKPETKRMKAFLQDRLGARVLRRCRNVHIVAFPSVLESFPEKEINAIYRKYLEGDTEKSDSDDDYFTKFCLRKGIIS